MPKNIRKQVKTEKSGAKPFSKTESILVTGGAGFIGSHVVDELISAGYKIVILDDLSGGYRRNIHPKAKFIKGSIENYELVLSLFEKYKFKYVFHLAAYAAEGLSHFIKRYNYSNNLIGSVNLINASILNKVECFVFTSSIAVYGQNQVPMIESLVPNPEDPYGIAKFAVELELEASKKVFGLNYIIFRPHNVYGERQNLEDKYRNVLGIFINKIKNGEPMPVFGDGNQKRAFSHIQDVAPIIAQSVHKKESWNTSYNIGADAAYTVLELGNEIAKHFKMKPAYKFLPERKEVKYAYSDHTKVREMFSHTPKVDLHNGVKKMVEWAKSQKIGKSKKFKNIEIRENLPPSWC